MKNTLFNTLRPYVPKTPGGIGGEGHTSEEIVESALAVLFCIVSSMVLLAVGVLVYGGWR